MFLRFAGFRDSPIFYGHSRRSRLKFPVDLPKLTLATNLGPLL